MSNSTCTVTVYSADAVPTPTFSETTGSSIELGSTVTISAATGCTLEYRIGDGSKQSEAGNNKELTMSTSGSVTLHAWAKKDGNTSDEASITLTVFKHPISPSFSPNSLSVAIGNSVAVPTLSGNTDNGTVTYTSSNTSVATVNSSTGEVTGVAEGEATITATIAETTDYQGSTATFTVGVYDPEKPGTMYNPYTVTQALTAIGNLPDNNATAENYYVRGIVSAIESGYYSRYWISVDGTNTNRLYIYNGKYLNEEIFTSSNALQEGDIVTVCGKLQNYKGNSPQIAANNYLVAWKRKALTTVTVSGTSTFNILDGVTATLTATVRAGEDALDKTVTWSSTVASVATVNATTGEVTPVAPGTTTIKATFAEDDDYKASNGTLTVTVNAAPTAITLNETTGAVDLKAANKTMTLAATVTASKSDETQVDVANPVIIWSSSNETVATVEDGIVTAHQVGEAIITATYEGSGNYAAASPQTCTITVNDTRTAVNMTVFSAAHTTLTKGDVEVTTVANDQAGWTAAYTYESDNTDVATVAADGKITAVAKGSATITATLNVSASDANYKAGTTASQTIDITVKNPSHTATFSVNGNTSLTASVEEGEAISFPEAVTTTPGENQFDKNIDERTFVGWVTSEIPGSTDSEPSFTSSPVMGENDITYYAVYADVAQSYSESETEKTQTLDYDSWTYSGTTKDKTTYRLFGKGSYIESAAFDLSLLKKVIVYGGTFGGSSYNSLSIGDGSNVWKNGTVSSSSQTGTNIFENGTALTGKNKLRITANSGDGSNSGLRISKVEIYTKKAITTNSGYCTTVSARYAVTVSMPANGAITVKQGETDADGKSYAAGTELVLTATPDTGYDFSTWTAGAGTFSPNATTASATYAMPAQAVTIGATFTIHNYTFTASTDNGGRLSVAVGDNEPVVLSNGETTSIPYNANVIVTPVAATNYAFNEWVSTDVTIASAVANPLAFTQPASNVTLSASFISADIEYAVSIVDETGGTIISDKNEAKAGETVTLSYTLDDRYAFDAWLVLDGSANEITVTDNQFTMPTSEVTVTASYKKIHSVSYTIGNASPTVVDRLDGTSLNLPTPADRGALTFYKWSTNNTPADPAFIESDITVSSDLTLYAMFDAGEGDYEKVTSDASITDGDYLIVYETDGVAFNGGLANLDVSENVVSVTIGSSKIANTATTRAAEFRIASISGGFSVKGTSKYIGKSAQSNGMDQSDEASVNTISISNGNAIISGTGGYQLQFNSNTGTGNYRFRYYANNKQQAIQLYKKSKNYSLGIATSIAMNEDATEVPETSKYSNVTLNRAFNAGWSALCLPFNAAAFSDAEIAEYDGEEADGDNVTMAFKKVSSFEANKPYLVYFPAAVASGHVFEGVSVEADGVEVEGTAFNFCGTYVKKDIAIGDWVIAGGKLSKASAVINLKPTRTYFTPKTANARIAGFFVDGQETTGILGLMAEQGMKVEGIYNLKGQKVDCLQGKKGIYVVSGKKIVK